MFCVLKCACQMFCFLASLVISANVRLLQQILTSKFKGDVCNFCATCRIKQNCKFNANTLKQLP